LILDVSIKTFNFKDRNTGNYRHNFTGRFYELLGEELDLRRSYRWATLVALIFLPADSVEDSSPSSFAHAVRQYSKIISLDQDSPYGFEHVFVAVHDASGAIFFYDAATPPPRTGRPKKGARLTIEDVMATIVGTLNGRAERVKLSEIPEYTPYQFLEPERD
jgi:hypothetical protein